MPNRIVPIILALLVSWTLAQDNPPLTYLSQDEVLARLVDTRQFLVASIAALDRPTEALLSRLAGRVRLVLYGDPDLKRYTSVGAKYLGTAPFQFFVNEQMGYILDQNGYLPIPYPVMLVVLHQARIDLKEVTRP